MTLMDEDSLTDQVDPFSGRRLTKSEVETLEAARLQREQVRQRLVAEYSSNPLYQARAAKDPEYWNTFSVGQIS